jgi:hypothetical protein
MLNAMAPRIEEKRGIEVGKKYFVMLSVVMPNVAAPFQQAIAFVFVKITTFRKKSNSSICQTIPITLKEQKRPKSRKHLNSPSLCNTHLNR